MIIIKKQQRVLYREIQRPRQIWLWIIILFITAFMWYGFIQQIIFHIPIGDKPAPDIFIIIFWLIFGIIFPIFMLGWLKLTIEVREDGLYIRYTPFHIHYRKFLFKDIEYYQPVNYNKLKRFGGSGLRINLEGETAYNMNGNKGIEIKVNNQTIVIGTERPEELKKAMDMLSHGNTVQ